MTLRALTLLIITGTVDKNATYKIHAQLRTRRVKWTKIRLFETQCNIPSFTIFLYESDTTTAALVFNLAYVEFLRIFGDWDPA